MPASEAESQDYQRTLDNAERLLGQPLSLPLGRANRVSVRSSGGSPPFIPSATHGLEPDSTTAAGRLSR